MFGAVFELFSVGKTIEYNGEKFIVVATTNARTTDNRSLFIAVHADAVFPAQTYLIPEPIAGLSGG